MINMSLSLTEEHLNGSGIIELIYSSNHGLPAHQIGEAIIGMGTILYEAGRILQIGDVEIVVFPIESGSLKTKFCFVRKHPGKVVIGLTAVITLLNQSFELINHFGTNKAYHQPKDVLDFVRDPKVLSLCGSRDFIQNSSKVVVPLKEEVNNLTIKYDSEGFSINCDSKEKYFEPIEESQVEILPELKNGETHTLYGGMTRINKEWNEIGFKYHGIFLRAVPMDADGKVSEYHGFLESDQVTLKAMIIRNSKYEKPELRIINISPSQERLFSVDDDNTANP